MVMRAFTWLVCAPALVVAAACGRGNATDDALKNDLALASQAQAYNPNFTPNEAGYAPQNALTLRRHVVARLGIREQQPVVA